MVRSRSTSKRGQSSEAETNNIATAADERKQRKKMQNRLNQRAFRSRNARREITNAKAKQRQFQIDRWRLDEDQTLQLGQRLSSPEAMPIAARNRSDQFFKRTWFPLPADNLLHLIKYNVYRGLWDNKMILECLTVQYHTPGCQADAICDPKLFPNSSVIFPVEPHRAGSLTPTLVQMNVVHSTWINILPFPTMRENLIKWEFNFDHSELVKDLVGDLINFKIFLTSPPASKPMPAGDKIITQEVDHDSNAIQTGLIVWGEPHMADSWEATPHFLRRWAWAVADCHELINSTNRWRMLRGERPLQLPKVVS